MSSKWKENQTDWVSCHSVAIQQADERMSHCSQTKITGYHVKVYVDEPRISNYYITVIQRTWDWETDKQDKLTRTGNISLKFLKELKKGREIRLTGYHATVLRYSKQMSACHTAVKRNLPDITSKITLTNQGSRTNISL